MTSSEAPVEIVPYDPEWPVRFDIAFRDYLRTHLETARDDAALKRRLARGHHFDRKAYTEAKRPFIDRVTRPALRSTGGSAVEGPSSR